MSVSPKYRFGNIDNVSPALVPFPFEEFDFPGWRNWMGQNFHLPLVIGFVYVGLVFCGTRYQSSRPPRKCTLILVLHNFGFALFSMFAFARTFPDLLSSLNQPNGFYHSVCSSKGQSYPYAFWSLIGVLSKVAELGDTGFLVMRKRKIIFLHWYHHATAMLYTWYVFEEQEPCHRWLMTMNFFIHSLMYTYFGLQAAHFKLPRRLAMVITTLQISQMIIGVFVNVYTWKMFAEGRPCDRSEHNLKVAFVMYASYLVLFLQFFFNSYCKGDRKEKGKEGKKTM